MRAVWKPKKKWGRGSEGVTHFSKTFALFVFPNGLVGNLIKSHQSNFGWILELSNNPPGLEEGLEIQSQ